MTFSGDRLRSSRERTALTQEQVGSRVGVPRELVSMWETEVRTPSDRQLERLAQVLHVSTEYLRGKADRNPEMERSIVLSQLPPHAEAAEPICRWLDFLDRWADFVERTGGTVDGPGKPPRGLDRGSPVTDARRASTIADEVRDFYRLGRNALPDVRTFLDERGILVYRSSLGRLEASPCGIAGVFFNHGRLGCCVLVNTDMSPGRQAFSLAHLYAHALYHYAERGVVCGCEADSPLERFADTFAPHFLVPRKRLRAMVEVAAGDSVDAYAVVYLARYFRVSYPTTLHRLLTERHVTQEAFDRMKRYSPAAIASRLGLEASHFRPSDPAPLGIDRYPMSVVKRTRAVLQHDPADVDRIAELLDVEADDVETVLLADPPAAGPQEMREFYELPG